MKRLTIDTPLGLHKRIKTQCAERGTKMADALRELLSKQFLKEAATVSANIPTQTNLA